MLIKGINNVTNKQYHEDREFISSSALKLLLDDPREYKRVYVDGEKRLPTDAMLIGSLVHTLVLEPEQLKNEYAVFDGFRKGAKWVRFLDENEDKVIVTKSMYNKARKIAEYVMRDGLGLDEFCNGKAEVAICDTLEGRDVKVKKDYRRMLNDHYAVISDLKTTRRKLSDKAIQEEIEEYHLDLSAALYVDLATKVYGVPHEFRWVFVNKSNGRVRVIKASEAMIENGRRKYKAALEQLRYYESIDWKFKEGVTILDPLFLSNFLTGANFKILISQAA